MLTDGIGNIASMTRNNSFLITQQVKIQITSIFVNCNDIIYDLNIFKLLPPIEKQFE